MTTNEIILRALQKFCGTAHVFIEFNGGGDSGQIDTVQVTGLLDADALEKLPVPVELMALTSRNIDKEAKKNMYELLAAWAYDLIGEAVEFDWINNEGGGGSITIKPYTGEIKVDAFYYENVRTDQDTCDLSVQGEGFEPVEENVDG